MTNIKLSYYIKHWDKGRIIRITDGASGWSSINGGGTAERRMFDDGIIITRYKIWTRNEKGDKDYLPPVYALHPDQQNARLELKGENKMPDNNDTDHVVAWGPLSELDQAIGRDAIDKLDRYAPHFSVAVKKAVEGGMTPQAIKRYLIATLGETRTGLVQLCYNAAKYYAENES